MTKKHGAEIWIFLQPKQFLTTLENPPGREHKIQKTCKSKTQKATQNNAFALPPREKLETCFELLEFKTISPTYVPSFPRIPGPYEGISQKKFGDSRRNPYLDLRPGTLTSALKWNSPAFVIPKQWQEHTDMSSCWGTLHMETIPPAPQRPPGHTGCRVAVPRQPCPVGFRSRCA